jgi:hypothetical protein
VVVMAVDTVDETGEKLAYNEISTFVRGAGGWGGDRGPSGDVNVPPAREPDAVIEEKTADNQTLLYRCPATGTRCMPIRTSPGLRLRKAHPARAVHLRLCRPPCHQELLRQRRPPLQEHQGAFRRQRLPR